MRQAFYIGRQFANLLLFLSFSALAAHAAQIKGAVHDEAGQPIAGVKVWLLQDRDARVTETASNGAYLFDGVRVAVSHLCAWKEGMALAGYSGFVVGDASIDLALVKAANIDINIMDGDFKVVPGARIRELALNGQFTVHVDELLAHGFPPLRADDSGNLSIPFVSEGGFIKFAVSHYQYRDSYVNYLPPRGKTTQILMYPGTKVQGKVSYGGKGLEGARVLIYTRGVGGQNIYAHAVSDAEGLYGLRLMAGQYHMAVRHPDYASPKPLELAVQEQAEPLLQNLEMRNPFNIKGTIEYPGGGGCGGARVQYRLENVIYEETFSDNSGGFSMRIPENKGELLVIPPAGYQTVNLPVIPLALDEAKRDITLNTIGVEKLPELNGVVQDPDGKPLSNVLITVSNLYYPIWAQTKQDGSFNIVLDSAPEDAVTMRFEHAQRFFRKDVVVELKNPALGEVILEEFKPNQEQDGKGNNDLSALIGERAPDLECAQWFNGEAVTLKELKGKVVVVNFWAGFDDSPAGYSRLQEIQQLQNLYANDDGVAFIGIHDAASVPEEVAQYVRQFEISYPVGLDKEPYVTFEAYYANFIPQTVLIDKKGKVQYSQVDGRLLELIKVLRRR